ncbi:MAG: dehypoxanthine futalosine cyclase [Candidatus Omnitrophica bacterium]|nr:dehypoxanthine futalosine cyclase [Candidatus Omnitrophota bacterium]
MDIVQRIIEKRLSGTRLTLEDGILLYQGDLLTLGKAADTFKRQRHPGDVVTFVVDHLIAYTNVCVDDCSFCNFYAKPHTEKAHTMPKEDIFKKIQSLVDAGGTQVMLQGGVNPQLDLNYYVDLLSSIRARFGQVYLHCFSPSELDMIARKARLDIRETVRKLKAAGLQAVPGAGAEILVDRVRSIISPKKISADRWIEINRACHEEGLMTTATMVVGHVETKEERIIHLLKLRDLQDETHGFRAFIPWTMANQNTGLDHVPIAGGEDYLKTMAISRLVLDNVTNFQTGWVTEGHKLAQVALAFGANDMGGVLMEEEVVSATGVQYKTQPRTLIRLIQKAGYRARQRNTEYDIIHSFD